MDRQQFFNLLYILLILGVLAFMIWLVVWLQGEGKECLTEPLKYYQNNTGLKCSCFTSIMP